MPKDSVEIVAAAYRALARDGLDSFAECWADDLVHRSIEGAPDDRGPINGRDAFRAFLQDWVDTFDEFRIEPLELIDAGGQTVVGLLRFGGQARLSGVETDQTMGVVFTVRDGRIATGHEYPTLQEALDAATG